MIQFNLLPDVKIEYIKAQRAKRTVLFIATVISVSSVVLLGLLFAGVNVIQKNHLNNLNKDIATGLKQLESTPNINKILTIQNQLQSLPGLHNGKPVSSRMFGYVQQLTPKDVKISSLAIDFATQKITISGTSGSISSVNKYVDTIKFTTYSTGDGEATDSPKAFSDVVLNSFSVASPDVSYQISFKFDPTIFDVAHTVKLSVPAITSTRSQTEKPGALFETTGAQ